MRRFVSCVLFGAVLFAPGATNAVICFSNCGLPPSSNTFNYQFQFKGGGLTVDLSGQLTASSAPDPTAPIAGGFDILSINGNSIITGLGSPYKSSISSTGGIIPIVPGLNGPVTTIDTSAGPFTYDNVLYYPQAKFGNGVLGYFDENGILFKDIAGTFYNIYTVTGDPLLFGNPDTGIGSADPLDLVSGGVSPVPEPSTWAMLLIGFAGLGLIVYRRKHKVSYSLV